MLFTFPNITIIYNKEIPINGRIFIQISNLTVFIILDGQQLFTVYPKGLSAIELLELMQGYFGDYEITINDSNLGRICNQIYSSF